MLLLGMFPPINVLPPTFILNHNHQSMYKFASDNCAAVFLCRCVNVDLHGGFWPGTMQQSKRVFGLYIWRNQGSVCIVDAPWQSTGVDGGSGRVLRGWDRVGVQQIFEAGLPSLYY